MGQEGKQIFFQGLRSFRRECEKPRTCKEVNTTKLFPEVFLPLVKILTNSLDLIPSAFN